jgi:hypothetical protein
MESLFDGISYANAAKVNRLAMRTLGHEHNLAGSKGRRDMGGGDFAHH